MAFLKLDGLAVEDSFIRCVSRKREDFNPDQKPLRILEARVICN